MTGAGLTRAGAAGAEGDGLDPSDGNPAITAAYRYRTPDRPLNVVVLSDGLTEPGDRAELLSLIRGRPSNARGPTWMDWRPSPRKA